MILPLSAEALAGMAAALKARESGVEKIIILERAETLGGILEQCIHTGFGLHYFGEELSSPEYAARFIELVENTDIVVKTDTMVFLHFRRQRRHRSQQRGRSYRDRRYRSHSCNGLP